MNKTQDFYNQFTYPFDGVKENCNIGGESIFYLFDLFSRQDGFENQTILDAGCGTGQRVIDIAKYFKKANFVGVDFSKTSISIAKEQALHDNVTNIDFCYGDIRTYQSEKKFNIINLNGVLHHIKNSKDVLHNVASNLDDDGILVTWCYHKYGEFDRMLNRDLLLTLLGDQANDYQLGIELMKELGMSISENRYGKSYGKNLSKEDQICKDADAFLNPYVRTFTFNELMNEFKDSGLKWIAFEQINYENHGFLISLEENEPKQFWTLSMKDYIKSDIAYQYYKRLEKLEKLHVIELCTKPTGFTVFAGRENSLGRIPHRMKNNSIFLDDI